MKDAMESDLLTQADEEGLVAQAARRAGRDLTTGSISTAIWRLAPPIMLGNMVHVVISLTDTYFVSCLGKQAIAAVGMSGQVMMLLGSVFMGIGAATTALVSRAVGARDSDRADHVATQALLFALLISVAVGVPGFIYSSWMLDALGAKPEVLEQGTGYLRIIFAGTSAMTVLAIGSGVLRGAGDAMTPFIISVIAAAVNVVLDPLLIRGYLFFPEMGVRGAALASVAAQAVGLAVGIWVLATGRVSVRLRLREFRPDLDVLKKTILIGIPMSVQMALRALMGLVLMGIVATFGTAVLAAYTVGIRLRMVGFMPGFGIAEASAVLVGQNLGAGKPERAQRSALVAAANTVIIMGTAGLASFIFAPWLMGVFSQEPEVIAAGASMLRISAPAFAFSALGIVLSRAIGGAGVTFPTMIITLATLWGFQVPAAYWLAGVPALGEKGIWIAMLGAAALQAIATSAYFFLGDWKRKKA